uniref:Uncharacterized protein LOC100180658 n=1 Tax=Phallusia mammillata TaxID=59560 RepID=A0A6F9DGL7_9ASCI|nr:uncharacterized protein LOC100180658 [Phallusia mammillata]
MNKPRVHYPQNDVYPPRRRRRNKGCSCDESYAKSLQGICKVIALVMGALTFIIVGASPYWRPIFVLEAVTWPFHVVMLVTILVWLATLTMYGLFLSGQHLEYPHVAWPTVELQFNVVATIFILFASILEASNVWRWDMSRGFGAGTIGLGGAGGTSSLSGYGYRPGMTFSQSLNFNSYCSRYPNDCTDYFSLLTGHNSYYGNHIFATILLFLLVICYLVSTYFAFRTWRVFKRDMYKNRDPNKPLPKPSAWERFRYRMSEVKMPTTSGVRDRMSKMLNRNDGEAVPSNDVEVGTYIPEKSAPLGDLDNESIEKKSHHASSVYSDGKSHRSHKSHHTDRRSRSSSGTRRHKDDYDSEYHGSSRESRSGRRSRHSGSESRSSNHKSHRSSDKKTSHHDDQVVALPDEKSSNSTSPVASVMV